MQTFTSFVILAAMRTGSNLLEETLAQLAGITFHGEAFNPVFLSWPKCDGHLGMTQADRDANPAEYLRRIRSAPGLNGFRFFPGHDQRVLAPILADPACAKIILSRNPVDSYLSLKIARDTGQWKLADSRRRKEGVAQFDADEFAVHLDELAGFYRQVRQALQSSGQTAFHIAYDELTESDVLTGLGRFLGLKADKVMPARSLVPQNPAAAADKVANPAEMIAALAATDPYALSHLPEFEPRRGPSVPGFIAARRDGAGLLFMPVRHGPTDRVAAWLAAIGDGQGPDRDFTRATLRDWMRDHTPHRRFTVLPHPVLRANRLFRAIFVDSRHPKLRDQLGHSHKIRLAPDDRGDLVALRAAFGQFLDFLRPNLKGQTAQRVEPIWASQAAILQGFADFAVPDLVIREDDLDQGLHQLCAALGIKPPPLPAPHPPEPPLLYDGEIEAKVRAAYARDYLTFGFGDYA